jgi:hypothetical protein
MYVPPKARFSHLLSLPEGDDIGKAGSLPPLMIAVWATARRSAAAKDRASTFIVYKYLKEGL